MSAKFMQIIAADAGESKFVERAFPLPLDEPEILSAGLARSWNVTQVWPGPRSGFRLTRTAKLLVVLEGELEIGVSSGQHEIFRAGDMLFATDTTGRGHTAAILGKAVCRVLSIDCTEEELFRFLRRDCS